MLNSIFLVQIPYQYHIYAFFDVHNKIHYYIGYNEFYKKFIYKPNKKILYIYNIDYFPYKIQNI